MTFPSLPRPESKPAVKVRTAPPSDLQTGFQVIFLLAMESDFLSSLDVAS